MREGGKWGKGVDYLAKVTGFRLPSPPKADRFGLRL